MLKINQIEGRIFKVEAGCRCRECKIEDTENIGR